jgi:hypothetical protein
LGEARRLGDRGDPVDHENIGLGQGIGQFGLVQPRRHLLLPEVEVAARELVGSQIGLLFGLWRVAHV